jgi:hypothetical protein
MNSNPDWAKCLATLRGNHFVNYVTKIINRGDFPLLFKIIFNLLKINVIFQQKSVNCAKLIKSYYE